MGKRSVDDVILVTGSGGLVGSALKRLLGPTAIFLDRASGDLRDPHTVKNLFERYKPKKVIHLAAVVGGVKSNGKYPADYYFDNVMINTNVLNSARAVGTQKILSYMSTCVFPDDASYPLTVDQLHEGEPHHSNFGYAYAKRMLEVQSRAIRSQFGISAITVIPTNIYGPNDNFHLDDGHVLPALIHRTHIAKAKGDDLTVWGSGSPLREFVFSDDIAKLSIFALDNYDSDEPLILSSEQETSIKDVVHTISHIFDFKGRVIFDPTQPDGQFRKPSCGNKIKELWPGFVWKPLDNGLRETIEWFNAHVGEARGTKDERI